MKTMILGTSTIETPRIALGCMRISRQHAQALATVEAALAAGIRFFDHANIYQAGQAEATFGALWDDLGVSREDVWIQTKCGIRPGDESSGTPFRYDYSTEHILTAVDESLQRLRTDYVDVLLLHRPDALVEPQEVAAAFDQLAEAGKVRWFGVSNHTPNQIALLRRWVDQPLIANQLELSPSHTNLIDEGVWMNRADMPEPSRGEGTLDYCRLHDITVQAWSPLARGTLSGRPPSQPDARVGRAASAVAAMAEAKGVSPEGILIAWILRHPAGIMPIIGTMNPERIAKTCRADEVELTREEWYALYAAGRGVRVP